MDELPRTARAVLALSKDAHDPPDPAARERVRAKVLAAVAPALVAGSGSALGPPHPSSAPTWFGSTKVMLTGALMLLAVGGGVWSLRPAREPTAAVAVQPSPPSSTALELAQGQGETPFAPTVEAAPSADPRVAPPPSRPADLPAPPVARAQSTGTRALRARVMSEPSSSLREELGLLTRAADQLARGDTADALGTLGEHRRRFAHTQLAQEREGLFIMARCQKQDANAQRTARAFLARSPAAVLATRVEQACQL